MPAVEFRQEILGDVSVGFSGGLDSTFVAYAAGSAQRGRVHLHTLDHGYGYIFNRWAAATARSLSRSLGDGKVVHRFVDTKGLFRDIAVRSLLPDRKTYGQWFGCCLGCTMAFVTKILIYNLENGVPHLMFGSSVGGEYAVMSMAVTVGLLKRFCASYGVVYSTPLLDNRIVKDHERAVLEEAGVNTGIRFLDKHSFGNQGYCLPSMQHLPDVLFNVHPDYDPDQVGRFFEDRLPRCRAHIEDHFRRSGRDLGEAITSLREMPPRREEPGPCEK